MSAGRKSNVLRIHVIVRADPQDIYLRHRNQRVFHPPDSSVLLCERRWTLPRNSFACKITWLLNTISYYVGGNMKRSVSRETSLSMDQRKQRHQRGRLHQDMYAPRLQMWRMFAEHRSFTFIQIAWPGVGAYDNNRTTEFSGNSAIGGLEWSQAAQQSYWRLQGGRCCEINYDTIKNTG